MNSKKLSFDILFNALVEFSIRLRGLIAIPLLTATIGLGSYGVYVQVLAVTRIFQLVFSLGLYDALVRFSNEKDVEMHRIYYSLATVSIVSGILAYILFYNFSNSLSSISLGTERFGHIFQIGGLLIITRIILKFQEDYYRAQQRMKLFSVVRGIEAYAAIGTIIASALLFEDLYLIFAFLVIEELILAVLIQSAILYEIGLKIPEFKSIGQYLRYSTPIAVSNLTSNISSRADRLMIGFFLGPSAVGLYSIAYQIGVGITILVFPIKSVFFSELSMLVAKGRNAEVTSIIRAGSRYFLMIGIPASAGLYAISEDLFRYLVRSSEAVPSEVVVGIIAFGMTLRGVEQIYSVLLNALESTEIVSIIGIGGAIGNVVMNYILIPKMGILGAALTTMGTYLLTGIALYIYSSKFVDSELPLSTIIRSSIGSLVMIVALDSVELHIVPEIMIGIAIYFAVIVLTLEITISELRDIWVRMS